MITQLDAVQRQLDDRERQMRVLEDLLLASRLQKEVRPSGWPIAKGWISSVFGARTDPFTGRRTYHQGVDFAGKRVAVIGTGSSGIQSIPKIAEEAETLTVFQRTPQYTLPAGHRPISDSLRERTTANYEEIREVNRNSAGIQQRRPRQHLPVVQRFCGSVPGWVRVTAVSRCSCGHESGDFSGNLPKSEV